MKNITTQIDLVKSLRVFGKIHYLSQFEDSKKPDKKDLVSHYFDEGYRSGKNPCNWFDTEFYLSQYNDVKESGVNPFFHFLVRGFKELRIPNPNISSDFLYCINQLDNMTYGLSLLERHQDLIFNEDLKNEDASLVNHLKDFTQKFINTTNLIVSEDLYSPYFDSSWYANHYKVPKEKALLHFSDIGQTIGLSPCEQLLNFSYSAIDNLSKPWLVTFLGFSSRLEYVEYNKLTDLQKCYEIYSSKLLDVDWYSKQYNKEIKIDNAYKDFAIQGIYQYRNPNQFFDQKWYALEYELEDFQIPLIHYIKHWNSFKFNPSSGINLNEILEHIEDGSNIVKEPIAYLLRNTEYNYKKDPIILNDFIGNNLNEKLIDIEEDIEEETYTNISEQNMKPPLQFEYALRLSQNKMIISGWLNPDLPDPRLSFKSNEEIVPYKKILSVMRPRQDVNTYLDIDPLKPTGITQAIELKSSLFNFDNFTIYAEYETGAIEINLSVSDHTAKYEESYLSIINEIDDKCLHEFLVGDARYFLPYLDNIYKPIDEFGLAFKIGIDSASFIPGLGVFLKGWLIDANQNAIAVFVKQEKFISTNLLDNYILYSRPDVNNTFPNMISSSYEAGMYGLVKNKGFSSNNNFELIIINSKGEIAVQRLNVDTGSKLPFEHMQNILAHVDLTNKRHFKALEKFVGEAVDHVWQNKIANQASPVIKHYGEPIEKPKCTVIVPIYGRADFLYYQIAQMSLDPFMCDVELLYVLDDPRILKEFEKYASDAYSLFRLPFTTVTYSVNLGYAGANNIGSSVASADTLLLLNSDVMPKDTGWLKLLLESYHDTKNVGILGARLLFEDDTIQHDGLEYFKTDKFGDIWFIDHPGKGLPITFAQPVTVSQVDSVTGACLMISKDIYNEVDGLDEGFAYGDFEDSDLCLKVLQQGYDNYIDRRVSLYHLERQSQNLFEDSSWKFKLTLLNAIKHTNRWDQYIVRLNHQQQAQ